MHSRPSVKHVLGVLEWFCMLSEKNTFSKKQYGFFTTLADPPGLAKDHKKYVFFFRHPSLTKALAKSSSCTSVRYQIAAGLNVLLCALRGGKIILLSVWNWWLQKLPNLPCLINFPPIANLWTFIPDPFLDSFNTLQPTPGVFSRPGKPLKTRSLQQKPCSKKIFFVSQAEISSPIVNTNDSWPAFQERREVYKSNVCLCRSPSGIFAEYDLRLEYLPYVCRPFTDRKKPLVAF